jgi:phosphotransferase system HPr (HPr) family protein
MTTVGPVRLTIANPSGLHARPAALFVRTAGGFGSAIRVSNTTRGAGPVDAKSILGVLGLGVSHGHEVELSADGDDAAAAIAALQQLIADGVGEDVPSDQSAPAAEH